MNAMTPFLDQRGGVLCFCEIQDFDIYFLKKEATILSNNNLLRG